MKTKIYLLLLLFVADTAYAVDVKISQLPLGAASTSMVNDSFPYVSSSLNVTKRLTLWDISNIPSLVSTYAPKASPAFTGNGTITGTFTASSFIGNASTATALASTPTGCGSNTYAVSIASNGDLTCSTVSPSGFSGTLTVTKGGTGLSSTTANQLLYSPSINVISGLSSANTGALVTSSSGVPSITTGVANRVLRSDGTTVSFSQVDVGTDITGQVPIVNGGTGASSKSAGFDALSPMTTIGDIIYGGASGAGTRLAGGSTGQLLTSNSSAAPSWTTATYPSTTTANQILYSSATNTVSGISTASTSALVTNSSSVPGLTSGSTANRLLRTDGTTISFSQAALTTDVTGTLPIANGGTNATTKSAAFDSLSPMTTIGDLIYGGSSGTGTRLANGTTGQVLTATTGSAPSWQNVTVTPVENVLEYQSQSGYGSTATKIPYYANTIKNVGTAITGANDSTNGASATINETGIYSVKVTWTSPVSTSTFLGISIGASVTTNVSSLTWGTQALTTLETGVGAGVTPTYEATWTGYISSGSVIRPHTNGVATGGASMCSFRIVKIL